MRASNADATGLRVDVSALAVLSSATLTLTGSAQQLPANDCSSVSVQAAVANSAVVRIGGSTGQHYQLVAGLAMTFDTDNTSDVWVIGTVGNIVNFLWLTA